MARTTTPVRACAEQAPARRVTLTADPRLRGVLDGGHLGFENVPATGHGFVLPARLSVPLVVQVRDSSRRPPTFSAAPRDRYLLIDGACAPSYLETRLAPLGAYAVLGPAITEGGGEIVDLDDIAGPDAHRLGERIADAATWNDRRRLLDGFLLERLRRGRRPAPEVIAAWALLARSAGQIPIKTVADEVGWSHKHLITKFTQQVGVVPRTAARLLRLERVWRSMSADANWAQIAAESGYADQPHLVREFRQFTGTTPGALVTG